MRGPSALHMYIIVCLSACLLACLPASLPACQPASQSVSESVRQSVRPSVLPFLSSLFVQSVADLEDDGILALQMDMRLNWITIYVPLICNFIKIRPCSQEKVKKLYRSSALRPHPLIKNGKVCSRNSYLR